MNKGFYQWISLTRLGEMKWKKFGRGEGGDGGVWYLIFKDCMQLFLR